MVGKWNAGCVTLAERRMHIFISKAVVQSCVTTKIDNEKSPNAVRPKGLLRGASVPNFPGEHHRSRFFPGEHHRSRLRLHKSTAMSSSRNCLISIRSCASVLAPGCSVEGEN